MRERERVGLILATRPLSLRPRCGPQPTRPFGGFGNPTAPQRAPHLPHVRPGASRSERESPVHGDFAEPSSGLEPETPSLPSTSSAYDASWYSSWRRIHISGGSPSSRPFGARSRNP